MARALSTGTLVPSEKEKGGFLEVFTKPLIALPQLLHFDTNSQDSFFFPRSFVLVDQGKGKGGDVSMISYFWTNQQHIDIYGTPAMD